MIQRDVAVPREKRIFSADALDAFPLAYLELKTYAAMIPSDVAWIGFSILLFSLSQTNYAWHSSVLDIVENVAHSVELLASMGVLVVACKPSLVQLPSTWVRALSSQAIRYMREGLLYFIVLFALAGVVLGVVTFARGMNNFSLFAQGAPNVPFVNDGTSLDSNAALLLLQGHNPYTSSSILDVARYFGIHAEWTTPLRLGQFAGSSLHYPSLPTLRTVFATDMRAGSAPEFESQVSYPALSFLTLVPFVLLNPASVFLFYLACYLLLIYLGWVVAKPEWRIWILLLGFANMPMWAETLGGSLNILTALLIVPVWLLRKNRWYSAVFLGLAVASKQTAWFFVPFYAILILRTYGLRETVIRLAIAGVTAALPNLPFFLMNPHAFLSGVLAPIGDPMFPDGVGLIALGTQHILPYFPEWVYSVLEYGSFAGLWVVYWKVCRKYPELAMLFATLPLLLAWRSLPSYFTCMAYPQIILMAQQRDEDNLQEDNESQRDSLMHALAYATQRAQELLQRSLRELVRG